MRRGKRRYLAKPLPIISGSVVLASDFVVGFGQVGYVISEIDVADLPVDAMYYAKVSDGRSLYLTPEARSKYARYQLNASPDPTYRMDPSYFWRDQAKGENNVEDHRPIQTDKPATDYLA